jgi:hypothetical protein
MVGVVVAGGSGVKVNVGVAVVVGIIVDVGVVVCVRVGVANDSCVALQPASNNETSASLIVTNNNFR